MDQALTAILKGATLTGLDMKKVLEHAAVICMLRRPLFSIFRHSCTFGDMVGNFGVSVWASARYEIWLLRALLIFAPVDMRSGFSIYAFMTDACLRGYGIGGSYIGTLGIRNLFDYDERWRFTEHAEDGETHRERELRQKHDNAVHCCCCCC